MNVYEIVQQNILKRLEEAINNNLDFKWVKPWKGGIIPTNYVSKKTYSGINLLLLEEGGYYLTYKQVVDLKGKIKKGAKKLPVVYWNFLKSEPSNTDEEDESEMAGNKKTKVIFKYYSVFHQKDIEGIDFPEVAEYSHEVDEESVAHRLVNGYKEVVPIKEFSGSSRAYYSCSTDSITVPALSQFKSKAEYYSTLFHEMVHSTGHESRLNREMGSSFGDEEYSKEELIAEIGSALLRAHSNVEDVNADNNSIAYLKGWYKHIKDAKPSFITSCAQQAQKAMNYIIEESLGLEK